jgi:hypothetical protein
MICRCPNHLSAATWPTHTHFPVFAPARSCAAASVIRRCGSLPWHGAQKNVLWNLRDDIWDLDMKRNRNGHSKCSLPRMRRTLRSTLANVYAVRSEKDKAIEWLERAYHQRDPDILSITYDPYLDNLREEPRYLALLGGMHLSE